MASTPHPTAPLASQLRPFSLEEFYGQSKIAGEGTALARAITEDRIQSSILYGPPGTGKTSLARIIAKASGAHFEELSAISAGVADVRKVMKEARARQESGRRTILFLDEIHRFSKSQQDALLGAVEEGSITLIGATTENPYITVNSSLLSRCSVYQFESLKPAEIAEILRRGAQELMATVSGEVIAEIAARAGGDARSALGVLEAAHADAKAAGVQVSLEHVEAAFAQKRPHAYDKDGDRHFDFASAFIKAMRGSDPNAALFYLAVMIRGGEDPRFIARRLVIFASEDVGNADARALGVAVDAAQAVALVGLPECRINLAQAVTFLALAPKSNASFKGIEVALADVDVHGALLPPKELRDSHHKGAREMGSGVGYVDPHAKPGHDFDYLPQELRGRRYYRASGNGDESSFAREPAGHRNDLVPPAEHTQ